MSEDFPSAVPEIRVNNLARAAVYYENCLGFHWGWGVEGIGQVSRGGNLFRVFYDFAWELPDRGGRKDDAAEREDARTRV